MARGIALIAALLSVSAAAAQQPGMLPGALPGKSAKPPVLGATPVPSAKHLELEREFFAGVVDPQNTLDLIVGRTRVMLLKSTPTRTLVADPAIATFRLLEPDGKQIISVGAQPGITVINLWFADAK